MTRGGLLSVFLAVVVSAAGSAAGQNDGRTTSPGNGESTLAGDWRGDSICVVRESACRDEDSLYHLSKAPDKADHYSLKADKIVEGKPVTMGTTECAYDRTRHVLECAISANATLRFSINGNTLQGTMTIQDNKLWRRITLKKVGT
jgi:hypothetical protein